jgi:HTH-type transcriptional regulator/antitoxin HipB
LRIDSIHDLAAAVRGRRLSLGLSQAEVAHRARVSRDWVNSYEAGKPTVELILVLRILETLDLRLEVTQSRGRDAASSANSADLDELLDAYESA